MATKKTTKETVELKDENKDTVQEVKPTKTTSTKKEKEEVETLKKQLAEQQDVMAKMMEKMAEMTKAMEQTSTQPNIQIVKDTSSENRKIKVISCIDCCLNLTTAPKGAGMKYTFPRFGTSHNIKMDNLEKCVHEHRNSFLRGDCYICDPEAVAELGLSEAYENLYDAKALNDIIALKNGELDVERIYGMGIYDEFSHELIDATARDNVIDAIANNLAKGVNYDRNLIYMLNQKLGIDLDAMASKAREVLDKERV